MAKPAANPVEKLLQERAQYVTWLQRLDASGDAVPAVPDAVRHKVRGDYEARLRAVVDELRTHAASIEEQLEEYRARKFELTNREAQAKETMSEAEVRHAVGEFDETKWQSIRGDTARILVAVREELSKTNGEIDRLSEVQSLIAAPVMPPTRAEPPPMPEIPPTQKATPPAPRAPEPARASGAVPILSLEPDPVWPAMTAAKVPEPPVAAVPEVSKIPVTPRAPVRPVPPPKPKEEQPGRTLWFPSGKGGASDAAKLDELAFLKSVSPAETPAPPKRASGGFTRSVEPSPAPPPPAPPPPAMPAITTADPLTPAARPAAEAEKSGTTGAKTLKCGECGTMNRPTEWYCERCGAELAAL